MQQDTGDTESTGVWLVLLPLVILMNVCFFRCLADIYAETLCDICILVSENELF